MDSVLIGVPGEDRGSVRNSGWVIFSKSSHGVPPRMDGLANPARTGEGYGEVFAQ